jgi:HSP20 family protein
MTETKPLTTPRAAMSFPGDFDQFFTRMMRNWPFNWPDLAPSSEPRALRTSSMCPRSR